MRSAERSTSSGRSSGAATPYGSCRSGPFTRTAGGYQGRHQGGWAGMLRRQSRSARGRPRRRTVVTRLRAQGAIVLGLTNVPEMGRGGESNNNLYGRSNNPYDLSRTPGGSSGGSAALVASGGAALSVGSDGGGSIRQPCHNTGIAGLKPTHGRIPRTGSVFGDALGVVGSFNCYGPLARSVQDLSLALSIMPHPTAHRARPCCPHRRPSRGTAPDQRVRSARFSRGFTSSIRARCASMTSRHDTVPLDIRRTSS